MKNLTSLQLITYVGNGESTLEAVIAHGTFDKWLEAHNNRRWIEESCGQEDEDHINKECCCIENENEFEVNDVTFHSFE